MRERRFLCKNFGECDTADNKKEFPISEGEKLICPECTKENVVEIRRSWPPIKLLAIFGCSFAVAALLIWYAFFRVTSTTELRTTPNTIPVVPKSPKVATNDLTEYLNYGRFGEASSLCGQQPVDTLTGKLCLEMNTPLLVDASFQYHKKDGQEPSKIYLVDAQELKDLTLTNKDDFRLTISASQSSVFFYIFQIDPSGDVKRLFPDPRFSPGIENPIKGNTYQVPSGHMWEWFYVDELPPMMESSTETLYFIASPWIAKDLEELYGKISVATTVGAKKGLTEEFLKHLKLRSDPTIKCTFYRELSFKHGK